MEHDEAHTVNVRAEVLIEFVAGKVDGPYTVIEADVRR